MWIHDRSARHDIKKCGCNVTYEHHMHPLYKDIYTLSACRPYNVEKKRTVDVPLPHVKALVEPKFTPFNNANACL